MCATPLSALAALPEETTVSPFYTGVSTVVASVDVSSSGCASAYGKFIVRSGYTADMMLELQLSSDGESWSTIKTWTTSGSGTLTLDKIYFVSSGFYYRTVCSADIYDSNDNFVEGIALASNSQYY